MEKHFQKIATELAVKLNQVAATIALLDDGATIPFIARYRKEVTGSLDEVVLASIRDRIEELRELDKRRESILQSMTEMEKLTPELEAQIMAAETLAVLEDIYLPFRPKRRTRATIAREKGLEPLADQLFLQEKGSLEEWAKAFISEEKGVKTVEEALAGARDIIAEKINEHPEARAEIRQIFEKKASYSAKVIKGKEEEGQKFRDYFEWTENIQDAPSHRVLALRRAENEGIITLDVAPPEAESVSALETRFVQNNTAAAEQVRLAAKDGYKRLLAPSMETEIRLLTKKRADEEAIKVFQDNLKELLLAAPLGQKKVLALDPGFRTGCKVVCLDENGKLVYNDAIYPNEPQRKTAEAGFIVKDLVEKYQIEAVAIGNGTASRETENFVKSLKLANVQVVMVNESGASIYSASQVARDEFPDQDITVRGAVSIGRRLMDPLAELVKIDPKSIGVGQYQHDVEQHSLKKGLDDTVISCVNAVGVEINTASKEILTYISGLGSSLAQNIIKFRNENGAFKSRAELKKVPRLGEKAFEQAAGFLRIRNAANPLDSSAVHPETYHIVEKMASDLGVKVKDLMEKEELRKQIDLKKYVSEKVGLPTLTDILKELAKPGRDPREQFEAFSFADGVEKISDLKVGMRLAGIVTNVTNFGAFVDIGVHQDGLVHLSQMANKFIKHPSEVVKVQQKVMVTVTEVDESRKRIALSMKEEPFNPVATPQKKDKNAPPLKEENLSDKLAMLKAKFKQ